MPLNEPHLCAAALRKFGMRAFSQFAKSVFTVTSLFVSKRGSQNPPVTVTFVITAGAIG